LPCYDFGSMILAPYTRAFAADYGYAADIIFIIERHDIAADILRYA